MAMRRRSQSSRRKTRVKRKRSKYSRSSSPDPVVSGRGRPTHDVSWKGPVTLGPVELLHVVTAKFCDILDGRESCECFTRIDLARRRLGLEAGRPADMGPAAFRQPRDRVGCQVYGAGMQCKAHGQRPCETAAKPIGCRDGVQERKREETGGPDICEGEKQSVAPGLADRDRDRVG